MALISLQVLEFFETFEQMRENYTLCFPPPMLHASLNMNRSCGAVILKKCMRCYPFVVQFDQFLSLSHPKCSCCLLKRGQLLCLWHMPFARALWEFADLRFCCFA